MASACAPAFDEADRTLEAVHPRAGAARARAPRDADARPHADAARDPDHRWPQDRALGHRADARPRAPGRGDGRGPRGAARRPGRRAGSVRRQRRRVRHRMALRLAGDAVVARASQRVDRLRPHRPGRRLAGKIARDLARLAARSGRDARVAAGRGRGRVERNPYKRNPVACVQALAAAIRMPGLIASCTPR